MSESGKQIIHDLIWPVMILLGLVLMSSFGLVVSTFFAPVGDVSKLIAQSHGITRLITLILVVPAIGMLVALDKVEGAAAIGAYSSLAGYLLGSTAGQ